MKLNRRDFLRHVGGIGAGAVFAKFGLLSNIAHAADYKALVCVFLSGGNDGNNTVIPNSNAVNTTTSYANYASVRGGLAINQSTLIPLTESNNIVNYGLHPSLKALGPIWAGGHLAVVWNVGTLLQPLTKAEYQTQSAPVPISLFSHSDQQNQWQSAISSSNSQTGWGGRLADVMASQNTSSIISPLISAAGNSIYMTGVDTQSLTIPVTGGLSYRGLSNNDGLARSIALSQLLAVDGQNNMMAAAEKVTASAINSAAIVDPILTTSTTSASTEFIGYYSSNNLLTSSGALPSNIANQFLAIAKIIEGQASIGAARQIFMVNLGSFDTHTNQLVRQTNLFDQLGPAMAAFDSTMTKIGAGSNVTTFTMSDFARTFKPNTNGGTDHAWGNHHFVMGGAVKGQQFYGAAPTLELGGPDDAVSEGRWIPTISVDQYAATLAAWFGVSVSDLNTVLPNVSAFAVQNIGFV